MKPFEHLSSAFREETGERLAELEATLLELEINPGDAELVGRAFRAMHTIKGASAMFGQDAIAAFTHDLETAFDLVRAGRLQITGELIALALRAKDLVGALLAGGADEREAERSSVTSALRALVVKATDTGGDEPQSRQTSPKSDAQAVPAADVAETFRIRFRPKPELMRDGTDPLRLLDELRTLGDCRVIAHTSGVPPLDALDPEQLFLRWDVVLTTGRGLNAIRDVFMFVEDRCELSIDMVDDGQSTDVDYQKIGAILLERGELSPLQLAEALAAQRRIGALLQERGMITGESVHAATVEQSVVRGLRAQRQQGNDSTSSVRVAAEKLDKLVDLVGELVIAQARLSELAGTSADPELVSVAEDIDRLATELRQSTLDVRMVPIGTTFGRFKRLVRDLATELGKEIDLVTEGAETELDKTVIERLADPLVHLIRNGCDHGIEQPDARMRASKPARGTIRLCARHAGASVVIEIQDDGAGLDAEAIRSKAIERGLIATDERPSEAELFKLVFQPGFSTAARVTNLSGRGVGMDVVKRAIDELRGTIEIESRRGAGAVFRIKLPLTLAIIDGLLVEVGSAWYVLPSAAVEECVELTREQVQASHGNLLVCVRGELVPYVRLRDCFGEAGTPPAIEQVMVGVVDGSRFGVVVDRVIGQLQTVIKTLGRTYKDVRGVSGATILGNGSVALIVDVPALAHDAGRTAQQE